MEDLENLFVDYRITVHEPDRIEVEYLVTGQLTTFGSLNDAVDHAAARTCTLSPRFPRGYRNKTVRMLDRMGPQMARAFLGMEDFTGIEEIVISAVSMPEMVPEVHPIVHAERQSRQYIVYALESDTREEQMAWLERSCDLKTYAKERREYLRGPQGTVVEESTDPYRHAPGSIKAAHTEQHGAESGSYKQLYREAAASDRRQAAKNRSKNPTRIDRSTALDRVYQ